MNSPPSSLTFNPFQNSINLLRDKSRPQSCNPRPTPAPLEMKDSPPRDIETERRYFLEAMKKEGIEPFSWNCCPSGNRGKPAVPFSQDEISDALSHLRQLIEDGEGFTVEKTPEYIEGTGACVPVSYAWRLHRGDFSIQAHIDLHGMNAKEARQAFDAFLKEAVLAGKRAVLIIHGRGLSSPVEPVLKKGVQAWLTSRAWRKWVIAFSSARSFDGGAGATYVLLREKPLSGNFRRTPRI